MISFNESDGTYLLIINILIDNDKKSEEVETISQEGRIFRTYQKRKSWRF